MIVIAERDMLKREFPNMSRDELDVQWREAQVIYEEAQRER